MTGTLGVTVSNLTQNIDVQVCTGSFYEFVALFFREHTALDFNKIIKNTIYIDHEAFSLVHISDYSLQCGLAVP
jgi:hypothetical protein